MAWRTRKGENELDFYSEDDDETEEEEVEGVGRGGGGKARLVNVDSFTLRRTQTTRRRWGILMLFCMLCAAAAAAGRAVRPGQLAEERAREEYGVAERREVVGVAGPAMEVLTAFPMAVLILKRGLRLEQFKMF